jgi:hypothetical protein
MDKRIYMYCLMAFLFSACSVFKGPPEEQAKNFDNWRLCQELADFTFKYHPQWVWSIVDEIKSRGLDSDPKCSSAYQGRMAGLMERHRLNARTIPFDEAMQAQKIR